jgi:hypothetical protein
VLIQLGSPLAARLLDVTRIDLLDLIASVRPFMARIISRCSVC